MQVTKATEYEIKAGGRTDRELVAFIAKFKDVGPDSYHYSLLQAYLAEETRRFPTHTYTTYSKVDGNWYQALYPFACAICGLQTTDPDAIGGRAWTLYDFRHCDSSSGVLRIDARDSDTFLCGNCWMGAN